GGVRNVVARPANRSPLSGNRGAASTWTCEIYARFRARGCGSLQVSISEVFRDHSRLPIRRRRRKVRRLGHLSESRQTALVISLRGRAKIIADAFQKAHCCERLYSRASPSHGHGGVCIRTDAAYRLA